MNYIVLLRVLCFSIGIPVFKEINIFWIPPNNSAFYIFNICSKQFDSFKFKTKISSVFFNTLTSCCLAIIVEQDGLFSLTRSEVCEVHSFTQQAVKL